jgi:putative transposase
MARATFYYQVKQSRKDDKHADVCARISYIYHLHNGRYGCRRITLALRNEGFVINHKRVERLMRRDGLKSLVRVKKYRSYRGQEGRIAPNVIKRDFVACRPNRKWATDVTEFALFGQKRYLSPVMDLYNGEIISYTISKHPNLLMVTSMVNKALKRIGTNDGLILHSDQGWHYRNRAYQNILKERGVIQSMSRKGNCPDNAAMESFFGILKSELLYLQTFRSIDHFTLELKKYIHYYNNQRIKAKLKGMSPVKYRTHSLKI